MQLHCCDSTCTCSVTVRASTYVSAVVLLVVSAVQEVKGQSRNVWLLCSARSFAGYERDLQVQIDCC